MHSSCCDTIVVRTWPENIIRGTKCLNYSVKSNITKEEKKYLKRYSQKQLICLNCGKICSPIKYYRNTPLF